MRKKLLKIFKIILLLATFIIPLHVSADILITEIMYNLEGSDSDREWIEIYNSGNSEVNIDGWRFFEGDTNHTLEATQGDLVLSSGEAAIVADKPSEFLKDHSSYSGTLIDSSFGLKNTGEFLEIRDADLNPIDSVTYSPDWGADGSGLTLNFSGNTWAADTPTPGKHNLSSDSGSVADDSEDDGPNTSGGSEEGQSQSVTPPSTQSTPLPDINLTVIPPEDRVVVAGADATYKTEVYGLEQEPVEGVRVLWSFGDGATSEGKNVLHNFRYPGDYVVFISASAGKINGSARFEVRALEPNVFISEIDETDGDFIKISNQTGREIDLSWWILEVGGEEFQIPENTRILADTEVTFSREVTGLDSRVGFPKLLYPNGEVLDRYTYKASQETGELSGSQSLSQSISGSQNYSKSQANADANNLNTKSRKEEMGTSSELNLDQATTSDLAAASATGDGGSMKWYIAFALLIVFSIGAVFYGKHLEEREKEREEVRIIED